MTEPTKHELQLVFEHTYSKHQILPRIKEYFKPIEQDLQQKSESVNLTVQFCMDFLAQLALRKRADLVTLVGIMRHHYDDAQDVTNGVIRCISIGLGIYEPVSGMFIVKYDLPPEIQYDIDRFQFPLPFVVKPKPVRTNKDTGFFTENGSIILKNNFHTDDVCLDHINKINGSKLTINHDVVNMIQNKWKDLDRRKTGETEYEFAQRKRAFEKYDRTSKDVIGIISKATDTFYLTHKYDKRGRTYSAGYHVNYQGNDWNKACVEFAEKEYVDD